MLQIFIVFENVVNVLISVPKVTAFDFLVLSDIISVQMYEIPLSVPQSE